MAAEQESIPEQINGKSEGNLPINGLSRKAILETLPDKTWYWCWETKDRKNPMQFGVNDDGQITVRQAPSNWKLELRWVMKDAGHLFVPMDDHTFRGFFIATGRPVTLFSDMVTNNLLRISSPEPGSQP